MPAPTDPRTALRWYKGRAVRRYRIASRRVATVRLTTGREPSDLAVGVIAHVHYAELWPELLQAMERVPNLSAIRVSATSAHAAELAAQAQPAQGPAPRIRIVENRGRDILAKATELRRMTKEVDVVLAIHTKRSPHASSLEGWRAYLLSELTQKSASVLNLFDALPDLGVAFPNTFAPVPETLGRNQPLMREIVGSATASRVNWRNLPFPAGSMFWARPQALFPWVEWAHAATFPEEAGQLDGTPAHALERLVLVSCELAGMTHLRISAKSGFIRSSQIKGRRSLAARTAWRLQVRALR